MIRFTEHSLGKVEGKLGEVLLSPDASRAAFEVATAKDKAAVVLDGERGPEFSEVGSFVFSPDGQRFGYLGIHGGMVSVVVDGKTHPWVTSCPSFGCLPDGRFTWIVADRKRAQVWTEGKPGERYDQVYGAKWLGNGLVIAARRGKRRFLDVTGREVALAGEPSAFARNANGTRLAFVEKGDAGNRAMVVVDAQGRETYRGPTLKQIGQARWSPDGETLAYGGEAEDGHYVFVGGKRGSRLDYLSSIDEILWAARAPKVLYEASLSSAKRRAKGSDYLMFGDELVGPFPSIDGYAISPNGREIAFGTGARKQRQLHWGAYRGPKHETMEDVVFSPDGKRVAYIAWTGWGSGHKRERVHVAKAKLHGEEFDQVRELRFTPDSKHVVYGAERKGTPYYVVDHKALAVDRKSEPVFSDDGAQVAFAVLDRGELVFRVEPLDGFPRARGEVASSEGRVRRFDRIEGKRLRSIGITLRDRALIQRENGRDRTTPFATASKAEAAADKRGEALENKGWLEFGAITIERRKLAADPAAPDVKPVLARLAKRRRKFEHIKPQRRGDFASIEALFGPLPADYLAILTRFGAFDTIDPEYDETAIRILPAHELQGTTRGFRSWIEDSLRAEILADDGLDILAMLPIANFRDEPELWLLALQGKAPGRVYAWSHDQRGVFTPAGPTFSAWLKKEVA